MKLNYLLGASSALCLGTTIACAQPEATSSEIDQKLKQLQQQFEQREQALEARFEKKIADQEAEITRLKWQLDQTGGTHPAPTIATSQPVGGTTNPPAAASPATGPGSTNAVPDLLQDLTDKVDAVVAAQKKVLPGEFNPAIGFVGELVSGYRSKSNVDTGADRPGGFDFFARSLELNASASVDPFAKGWVVANATADSATGESTWGIEEGALQTTSLPWNLTLTAGRFFGEFGKLSNIHDHELPFVNRPLVLDAYVGGESRTDGAQLNWLAPLDQYISLTAGVGNNFGGDAPNPNNPGSKREFGGLNFWGRASTYFDLPANWQLEAGISGLYNPSTQDRGGELLQPNGLTTYTEKARRLVGADFKLSYVPLRDNQFNSFTWGTEVLFSDNNYLVNPDGLPGSGDEYRANEDAFGLYTYVNYKWSRRWSAGFLFDYVQAATDRAAQTYGYSPYLTFALSHWNQLRLQYTHTQPNATTGIRPDDAVYLQWSWIIGAHSHGWMQR